MFSFYETQATDLGVKTAMIVQRESATLGLPGERATPLDANHRGVCKFELPSNANYTMILDAFRTINNLLMTKIRSRTTEQLQNEIEQIDQYLGGAERPEDDLKDLEDARMEGSCEWFATKESFHTWMDEDTVNTPKLYWVSARPATGKSVLAGYVVNMLQNLNADCAYYFLRFGDKEKSTTGGLFRSLAFQMALINVEIRNKLLQMIERGIRFDKKDGKAVWRKVLVPAVFGSTWHRTQFWVLDALDECSDAHVLFSMLGSMELDVPLKIFITSRKTTELATLFRDLQAPFGATQRVFEEMSFQDTRDDMSHYLESNRSKLHVGSPEKKQEILHQVLEKSEGCFLWIRLVLDELATAWSVQHVEKILEEMPQDMDRLYTRALSIMSSKPAYARQLAQAIIVSTICSTRPLTVAELRAALEISRGDEIQDLEGAIASLCAQVIHIDKSGRVLIVHLTARTFLTNPELDSEFAVDRKSGHLDLAIVCLRYMCSDDMKPPRGRRAKKVQAGQDHRSPFCQYACSAFAEHMRQTTSRNDVLATLLEKFFQTNVLSWIEYVASTKNLFIITQTSSSLKNFLLRRIQHTPPLSGEIQTAESWIVDLQRIPTKFGDTLISCPSSIHTLIPPFCPASSAIGLSIGSPLKSIQVKGLTDTGWDDRLACIHKDQQVAAVACGESFFAVGQQLGPIILYHNNTCQERMTLQHQNSLRQLQFDSAGTTLASVGRRDIRVWSVETGDLLWHFTLGQDVLALAFFAKGKALVAATRSNMLCRWSLQSGKIEDEISWATSVDFGDEGKFRRPPLTIAFSPDESLLAIVYRGRPISLWDLEERELHGLLGREMLGQEKDLSSLALGTNTSPASLVFNINEALPLLAAAYEDGDLCLFDYEELKLLKMLEANAQLVACSGDGLTLVSGNSAGMVQLMEFETLELLYQVNAVDYGIRSLAFSADNLRFLDARDTRCNVWEPAVLSGLAEKSDVSADGAPVTAKIIGMSDVDLEITTFAVDETGGYFFIGKSDGTVCVYATEDGRQRKVMYRHTYQIPVTSMSWSSQRNLIVTADAASRFIANALQKDKTSGWAVAEKLMDIRIHSAILDVLINPSADLLLVSTSDEDVLWNIDEGAKKAEKSYTSREAFDLLNSPLDPNERISVTATSMSFTDWSSVAARKSTLLGPAGLETLPVDQDVKRVTVFCDDMMIAVEFSERYGERSTTQVMFIESSDLDQPIEVLTPLSRLEGIGQRILHLIGGLGSKLLFLSRDLWVCSIDVKKGHVKGDYVRHFPIPADWRSQRRVLRMEVTPRGDILFVRTEEVAVIKNGLQFEEAAFLTSD